MTEAFRMFGDLTQRGEAALDELIRQRGTEELYLDFKRSADQGKGNGLHADDRKNLSKAISGFGNSAGGLIVWGVDCPSPREGRDDAAKEQRFPLINAQRFKANLDNAIAGATVPPHPNVLNSAFAVNPADGSGYVATLVPISDNAPLHIPSMATYYMRAGSTFAHIPHAVLAAMFGRRPTPLLRINVRPPGLNVTNKKGIHLVTQIEVENYGLGIATDLYMTVNMVQLPNPGASFQLNWLADPRFGQPYNLPMGVSVISSDGHRFPPGSMAAMFGLTVFVDPPVVNDLAISISVGSENGPPASLILQQQKLTIDHCVQLSWGSNASANYIAGRALGLLDDKGDPVKLGQ